MISVRPPGIHFKKYGMRRALWWVAGRAETEALNRGRALPPADQADLLPDLDRHRLEMLAEQPFDPAAGVVIGQEPAAIGGDPPRRTIFTHPPLFSHPA